MEEVKLEGRRGGGSKNSMQRSYFDVLGICCTSEVPLIEKILLPLKGVEKVNVVVTSRTVIVVHDTSLITTIDIVKALNEARLEATVRSYGSKITIKKWPSPFILICGILLAVSLFHTFYKPLRWLALGAVCVGLYPIILRSIASIRRYTLDINILMLIAVAGSVALRDYTEAGFIIFLFTIAEWLESRASSKATAGMSALMSLAPQKAILAETGQVVDAQEVQVNTLLSVKAGEIIPIDGIVVEGRSEVNEQSLTGESFPVSKQESSLVWAGTLNIDGYIKVKTTALAEDSAVARMAKMVEEAQNSRSSTQRLIDSCTKYYTPTVVVIATAVAVIPVILRVHNTRYWMQLALVLLVSACPCALVLSTPVATFCSLLTAAKTGLLIKGGDVLEALASTRVVAFDKTGTITRGEFRVVDFVPIGSQVTMHTLLYWVASIESKSSHPMASALVDHAQSNSINPKPEIVYEFEIYPGEGVCGVIDEKKIYVGNKRIATRAGCQEVPKLETMEEGLTLGYVFICEEPIGMFALSDTCRTGVADAIRELKSLGVKSIMLTGDSTSAATHAQIQLGSILEELHAELLPDDKVRIINNIKSKVGPTVMVGDGMNDAPALAAANVGISMGVSGSAVAMETSHITLMSNDIKKIPKAITLAIRTRRTIIVNIVFSLVTKVGILALALAGHPLLWAAVLADVGTCLLVILNSMTLLRTSGPKANHKHHHSCHASDDHKHHHKNHCGTKHNHVDAHKDHVKKSCSSTCCSEEKKAREDRIVVVGCKHEHHGECEHGENESKEYSCDQEKKETGSCCKSEKEEHGNGDCCSSSSQESPEITSCCQSDCSAQVSLERSNSCESACCTGSTNAKDEHIVVIGCMEEHRNDAQENQESGGCCQPKPKKKKCCESSLKVKEISARAETKEVDTGMSCETKKKDNGGCCKSETQNKDNGGCCKSETQKKDNGGCCKIETQKKDNGGCCKSETQNKDNGGCCKSEAKCGNMDSCSSVTHWRTDRREIGGCCSKSYRKKCCGGVIHLPEIITE